MDNPKQVLRIGFTFTILSFPFGFDCFFPCSFSLINSSNFLFDIYWRIMQTALQSLYHLLCTIADFVFLAVFYENISRLTQNKLYFIFFTGIMHFFHPFVMQRTGTQIIFSAGKYGFKSIFYSSFPISSFFHNRICLFCQCHQSLKAFCAKSLF